VKHLSVQQRFLALIAVVTSTTIMACGGASSGGPGGMGGFGGPGGFARATTVEVRDVNQSTISDQIRAYGSVRAQDNVRVTPQVSERVLRISADLGDTVRAGQTLAKLNDVTFREQMERDRAQVEQARIAASRDSLNLSRQQELFRSELISQAELDNARSTYAATRAQLQSAQAALATSTQNLGYTEVKSPVTGVITRRNASPGDVVGSGTTFYEISNLVGYEIRLNLPLNDWRNTRVGQSVEMRQSGGTEFNVRGTVSRISPELDAVTGLGEVVISLTERGSGVFPGMLMEARINVETKNNVVVIPRSAMVENVQTVIEPESNVIRLRRTYSAFVSQGDTVAVRRDLELGIQQGDRIEVMSGLQPGDKLIITGQTSLEDQSRIRISGAPRFDRTGAPQQIQSSDAAPGSSPESTTPASRPAPSDSGATQRPNTPTSR
jgi:RND family efflux transporter MFP subunit